MAQTLNPVSVAFVQQRSTLKPANRSSTDTSASIKIRKQVYDTSVPPLTNGIRVVTAAEYKEAAACLAEAFAEDDVARYFIDVPDREHWTEAEKWALHVEILEYVTYAHILKGLVTTVGDFESVALW
jgi:hypothetical protein